MGRVRIGSLGVSEALSGDVSNQLSPAEQAHQQQQDIMALGQLLLTLACSVGGLPLPSLDFAAVHYSQVGGGGQWRVVPYSSLALFVDNTRGSIVSGVSLQPVELPTTVPCMAQW